MRNRNQRSASALLVGNRFVDQHRHVVQRGVAFHFTKLARHFWRCFARGSPFCIRGVQSPLFFTVVQLLLNVSLGPINRTDFVQHLHDGFIRAAVQRTFKRANSGSNTGIYVGQRGYGYTSANVDALSS